MERNRQTPFCYQTLLASLMLVFVFLCFVLTWWIFHLESEKFIRRPGINIKEL
jgi:hypothetical protein